MVLEYRVLRVGTIPFDENTTKTIEIPRVNAIRWIDLAFFVESVEGGSANPTEIQDTILNIIKKIRLVVDGDENKINIDGRKAFFLEKLEKGVEPYTNKDEDHLQSGTQTWRVNLRIDFAVNRLNELDTRALLPARLFSKLDLEIDWGDLDDMYSANKGGVSLTDANSGCKVHIREVIDTENKVAFAKGQAGEGFIDYRETTASTDVDATHTNLTDDTLEHTVKPSPRILTKQLILTKDSSGVRQDDTIEKIRLEDTRGAGKVIADWDWPELNRYTKAEYQIESLDAGIALMDFTDTLPAGLETDVDNSVKYKIQNIAPTGIESFEVLTRYINGRTLVKPANA